MRYRLLGPLQVVRDDSPVDIGSPKQRAALAVLLLAQGRVVSVDPCHEDHTLLRELTPETVDALLSGAGPGSGSVQAVVGLRMLGGALAREPQHRSAFCHRDAAFALTVIGALVLPVAGLVPAGAAAVVGAVSAWSTGTTPEVFRTGQVVRIAP